VGQALRTPLCEALGIEYPIFSVGMGPLAGPDLVAAVTNAGGFGVLGTSGMQPDQIARRVAGESCSVVNDIKPAGEIVRDLVSDANAALG